MLRRREEAGPGLLFLKQKASLIVDSCLRLQLASSLLTKRCNRLNLINNDFRFHVIVVIRRESDVSFFFFLVAIVKADDSLSLDLCLFLSQLLIMLSFSYVLIVHNCVIFVVLLRDDSDRPYHPMLYYILCLGLGHHYLCSATESPITHSRLCLPVLCAASSFAVLISNSHHADGY